MHRIYENILNGICEINQISSYESLKKYLKDLQPYALSLWQSYRRENVKVNYSDLNIQAAYLIRYYPLYAAMTLQVFKDLSQRTLLLSNNTLQVCLFGAGPAPEAVGLINYLKNEFPHLIFAEFKAYDLAADAWGYSRYITKNYLLKEYFAGYFTLNGFSTDMRQINAFKSIKYDIQSSMIFVIQNCLNEIDKEPNIFLENIGFLVNEMPEGSILAIADQSNYNSTNILLNRVESYVRDIGQGDIIRSYTEGGISFHSLKMLPEIPPVIRECLLTGQNGLIPRSSVKFNYLAFQKRTFISYQPYTEQLFMFPRTTITEFRALPYPPPLREYDSYFTIPEPDSDPDDIPF
ncbi:hypothetical protein NIES4103_04370 [Nostoc sp. NIES-4103]|nr:hypothetical protein NIES4103_04370 [Nostoc sp. NIES-4103]